MSRPSDDRVERLTLALAGCSAFGNTFDEGSSMAASDGAWAYYSAHAATDRASLSVGERGILAILDLRQEVASGGFDAYFRYWRGDTAEEALLALPTVLDEEWVRVLREAMNSLGAPYPSDPEARALILDEGVVDERLQALDERIYELEADAGVDTRIGEAIEGLRR
ncbi:hypothetical protein ARHIZOSPH14_25900 [Agromyces rhizosphaerae]|uniref:DNA mimic protein DMP19 C-terminal domain-containing protein n=1 Tax=Agromyces rhizosphaerae TaxID=88374 RepID=A0A9W6CTS9_9MICO|nr:DUF4375 domain-containing protein [Agromyces rhizosphaerae]GLI28348.1 hypothetical protein ARHIZOSPH14_25900 [Agromyces rhizosphaerae]